MYFKIMTFSFPKIKISGMYFIFLNARNNPNLGMQNLLKSPIFAVLSSQKSATYLQKAQSNILYSFVRIIWLKTF